jgi:hypothetical protein
MMAGSFGYLETVTTGRLKAMNMVVTSLDAAIRNRGFIKFEYLDFTTLHRGYLLWISYGVYCDMEFYPTYGRFFSHANTLIFKAEKTLGLLASMLSSKN